MMTTAVVTPTCLTDPCWHEIGSATWQVLNSPFIVMLIGVGLAAFLAFLYQWRLKRFEMQWQTYKEMVENMTQCLLRATWTFEPASDLKLALVHTSNTPNLAAEEARRRLGIERELLADLANAGFAIEIRLRSLFTSEVGDPWSEMVGCFREYAKAPEPAGYPSLHERAMAKEVE